MWFKNLCLFQFTETFSLTPGELEGLLAAHPLGNCPGGSPSSQGWLPVISEGGLADGFDRHLFVHYGEKQRLLPGSVVSQAVQEKVEEYAQQRGYKPGRKLRMEFKDEITARLLPQAFVVQKSQRAWLDGERGWLIVDAASATQAEKLVELMREHLPQLPRIILPETDVGAQTLLTEWLGRGSAPGRFALDDEAEVQGHEPTKATIRYSRMPVGSAEELRKHLNAGKRATKLGLCWDDRVSFVLTDTLQIKRLKLLDTQAEDDTVRDADPMLAFETDMRLMTGMLRELLADLAQELGMRGPTVATGTAPLAAAAPPAHATAIEGTS